MTFQKSDATCEECHLIYRRSSSEGVTEIPARLRLRYLTCTCFTAHILLSTKWRKPIFIIFASTFEDKVLIEPLEVRRVKIPGLVQRLGWEMLSWPPLENPSYPALASWFGWNIIPYTKTWQVQPLAAVRTGGNQSIDSSLSHWCIYLSLPLPFSLKSINIFSSKDFF